MKTRVYIFTISVFAALLLIGPASICSAENTAAEYLVESGIKEMNKGNDESAIRQFDKALMLDPYNSNAHYYIQYLGTSVQHYSDSPNHTVDEGQIQASISQFQAEIEELKQQKRQLLFKIENVEKEADTHRFSYLNDYGYIDSDQYGRAEFSDKSVAQLIDEINGIDTSMQEYVTLEKNAWHQLSEQASNVHFPRSYHRSGYFYGNSTNYSRNNNSITTIDGYHDLQTMVNFSSRNELYFHLWLNNEPDASYHSQFEQQDQMVNVLDEYLQIREAEINDIRDDLVAKDMDLKSTELDLIDQIKTTEHLNDIYSQVMKKGEGEQFYVIEESNYMQYLEDKLDRSQDEVLSQNVQLEEQSLYLARIEQELADSRSKVSQLLEEREKLLNEVIHEVNFMQKQKFSR